MRIAYIFFDGPQRIKGPGVNASRLLPELVSRGHEVDGLCMYHNNEPVLAEHLQANGVVCHIGPSKLGFVEDDIRWILRTVQQVQPDVFVANLCVAGYYAAHWIRPNGVPTIACHRSDDAFYWSMVERFVCGPDEWAVSGLVCVSQHLRDVVGNKQPQSTKLSMIPSGVPVPRSKAEQDGPLRLVYAGRLVQQQKRIEDLLESVICFLQQNPEASFTMIGEGAEKTALIRRITESHCTSQITVKSAVEPWEIQRELLKHKVFVLLSDYEGTPGAVMDAMACGLVPVCLDLPGGVRELIKDGNTGILVRDRKTDFHNNLRRLGEDRAWRYQLAAGARQRIIDCYSLQRAADRWVSFCQMLTSSPDTKKTRISRPFFLRVPPPLAGFGSQDGRRPTLVPRLVKRMTIMRRAATACKRRLYG